MSLTATPAPDAELDEPDDAALMAAAQRDAGAFAALYRRYVGVVYRYCYLRLGEPAAAEDATSEAFLKALAALPSYRHEHFAAWLFRIARNTVYDMVRRSRTTMRVEASGDRPAVDPTPEDWLLAQDRLTAIREVLDVLPASQRVAVELQLAGWTLAESAAVLDTTVGAVKLLRYRAVGRLRRLSDCHALAGRLEGSDVLE